MRLLPQVYHLSPFNCFYVNMFSNKRLNETVVLSETVASPYPLFFPAALSSWNSYHPTKSASRKIAERDFIALNKSAVQSGLTTAQEQTQFRATHDIRRRDESERISSRSAPQFPRDMVFGISTR